MTSFAWPLVVFAARFLDRDEHEAVLGDLVEGGESAWQGLRAVLGLVLRRQALLWKAWRPWFASFVITIPASYLLSGVSISVTCTAERVLWHKDLCPMLPTGHEGYGLLLCHAVLLVVCAWAAGFLVGSLARRTVWVSAVLCVLPTLATLPSAFEMDPFLRWSMVLFLAPAVVGVLQAFRFGTMKLPSATLIAVTVTILLLLAWTNHALWVYNWFLLVPTWCLVATAHSPRRSLRAAA